MYELLRKYIFEAIAEQFKSNPAVGNQLLPRKKDKSKSSEEEDKVELDEFNTVANVAGFTAPLGASNLDVGYDSTCPGGKLKKKKKTFARWK